MRKLLLLVLLFVGLCILSVMSFNALTQISLQARIEKSNPENIDINKAFTFLQKALQSATVANNTGEIAVQAAQNFRENIAQYTPKLTALKEFQITTFEKYHLAFKWQGAQGNAPYIVLIAPYSIKVFEDFVPAKINGEIIEGSGTLQSKTALVALLSAMENLANKGFRPKRNILILAPYEYDPLENKGLKHMAAELEHFNLNYLHILYAGSGNQIEDFAALDKAAALIGVLDKQILNLTLSHKDNTQITNALNDLQKFKLDYNISNPANAALIDYLSPETSFAHAFYLSNTWLIESITTALFAKESRLVFANELQVRSWKERMKDGNHAITLNLQIPAAWNREKLLAQLDKAIFKKMGIEYELEAYLPANMPKHLNNKSFELLQTTIKQSFGDYVVLPAPMDKGTGAAYLQYQAQTPVLYYTPFNFDKESYLNAYYGQNEKLSKSDFSQMIQFYIQYLKNCNI